jgi:hypothetical protein
MSKLMPISEWRRWTFDRPSRVAVYVVQVIVASALVWWTRHTLWPWLIVSAVLLADYSYIWYQVRKEGPGGSPG